MTLTIPAAVLLALILAAQLRNGTARAGGALTAALFGFFLASTGIAPAITHALDAPAITHALDAIAQLIS
ncbi:hypothetical protein ABT112_06620 [Streptomyces sp. NPDC002055]|uniref:hypothetical protein n=1 Tax=Streptomyces sp. NPDC002055 TaxID=3154534 RepID=UPI00331D1EFF